MERGKIATRQLEKFSRYHPDQIVNKVNKVSVIINHVWAGHIDLKIWNTVRK